MKNLIYIFIVMLLFAQCNNQNSTDKTTEKTPVVAVSTDSLTVVEIVDIRSEKDILGMWSGAFDSTKILKEIGDTIFNIEDFQTDYWEESAVKKLPKQYQKFFYKDPLYGYMSLQTPNKISIKIEKLENGIFSGKSICSGFERTLNGTFTRDKNTIQIVCKEPGDEKYDGEFNLVIDMDSSTLIGTWKPFNDSVSEQKTLSMSRKDFKYIPNAEEFNIDKELLDKNVSTDILKTKEVENQSKQRLRMLRNLIYARHGYTFKNKDVRNIFEGYEWYLPVSADVRDLLSPIEKQNEALMKRYEDYAKSYYDDFGR
ncbi:MAG: YARHG domain-containing protein [Chitinophagales bacterium]|nr:YARHG domain-containing protein [Chitinophagales bacterium]